MRPIGSLGKKLKFQMDVLHRHGRSIFDAGLGAVLSEQLVNRRLTVDRNALPNRLIVDNHSFTLSPRNVYVVGFGKATLGMASVVNRLLEPYIVRGLINVPCGAQEALRRAGKLDQLLPTSSPIRVVEGAKNNLPDEDALEGAKQIHNLVQGLSETDLLLVLISGGGSALLPFPIPPITLADKIETIKVLSKNGVTIQEMNCIRQQMSVLKGGGLARAAFPAKVLSLIISDVIGDQLEFIASGPTVYVPNNSDAALDIIKKYNLHYNIPDRVLKLLLSNAGENKNHEDKEKFARVTNVLLGNNNFALTAASQHAQELGYHTISLGSGLQNEARDLGEFLALLLEMACCAYRGSTSKVENQFQKVTTNVNISKARANEIIAEIVKSLEAKLPVCLIGGGETTVVINGNGIGGRNQELILSSCIALHKNFTFSSDFEVLILSAGTDGIDGPTLAAGAITYIEQFVHSHQQSLDPDEYLKNNDSNTFFSSLNEGKHLIVTGHTGTNVMDIQLALLIERTV